MESMRQRFTRVTSELLETDPRLAVVLADIGDDRLRAPARARHPDRVINVGIREQLMIGVAAGLALEGMRPIAHCYAPFLVERPSSRSSSISATRTSAPCSSASAPPTTPPPRAARTRRPATSPCWPRLPAVTIHVPGPSGRGRGAAARRRSPRDGRAYIRLSGETNAEARPVEQVTVVRAGRPGDPLILAVGPTLDPVLEATADRSVTVAYVSTVVAVPGRRVRASCLGHCESRSSSPTSPAPRQQPLADALRDEPRRLLTLGVPPIELRRYGTPEEHRRAYGLDAAGIRRSLDGFARRCSASSPSSAQRSRDDLAGTARTSRITTPRASEDPDRAVDDPSAHLPGPARLAPPLRSERRFPERPSRARRKDGPTAR